MTACLTLVPEAREGDWVLVHAGFAIQTLDEKDALETWKYLNAASLAEVERARVETEEGSTGPSAS